MVDTSTHVRISILMASMIEIVEKGLSLLTALTIVSTTLVPYFAFIDLINL